MHPTEEGTQPTSAAAPGQSDVDAARALLAQEEQARMQACAAEIQEVLAKYGLALEVPPPKIALVPAR